jgi:hypothetical protein
LIRDRFFSFSIVLAIGFLLLVSLIISVLLGALGIYLSGTHSAPRRPSGRRGTLSSPSS